MNDILEQLREQFAAFGPNLLAGLAILVFGWLLALIASFIVRKALSKVSLDNKIAQWMAGPDAKGEVPIELWAGKVAFYLVMLLVIIAFMETIKLNMATVPLNEFLQPMVAYLPHLVGAGLLLLIAWVLAIVFKNVLLGVLKATRLDEKLGSQVAGGNKPMALSKTFAEVVYWVVFLLFLPAILQALQLQSLLEPVTNLFNKVFTFLPNAISAAAILVVGWFIARIVQRIIENLLASAGVDRLSETWGMSASLGKQKLSHVLGLVLYFIILVPVLIAALDALQLTAVTQPASDMLDKVMNTIPNVLGALIVILLAVFIGKIVSGIVTNVLAGLGFNNVPVKLGLAKQAAQGKQTPSTWVGMVVMALIILLAAVTAADMLELPSVGDMVHEFITFAGHILMGCLIFGLGLWLAEIVTRGINASDSSNARRLALAARIVILALAGAMALRQTGLANEIVNLAFGLILGAAAVAFALAFGLGGRDMATRTLDKWCSSKSEK